MTVASDAAASPNAWRSGPLGSGAQLLPQPRRPRLRLQAVGKAYLDFARTEPGLFDTAFTETNHAPTGANNQPQPLEYLQHALDDLVRAGILEPARRPNIEYPTWATVHGFAVLLRGPLRSLSDREKTRLETQTLAVADDRIA